MYQGLRTEEVLQKQEQGLRNVHEEKGGRSVRDILRNNLLTFFNLLNLAYFILVLIAGSLRNGLFMFVILLNSAIGIIQELRTKKKLDELKLLSAPKQEVLRDGEKKEVPSENLVPGDLVFFRAGDQIPADCTVLSGEAEVNESMLTGEEDNVKKRSESILLSGSYLTGGSLSAIVDKVGKDCYAESISREAKRYKEHESKLRDTLNGILKLVSVIIIPLSALMFIKAYFISGAGFRSAIIQLVTSGVGMIPEGLVLLTSIALTLGTLRLAQKGTIVQELFCIETLARVNILCLDKTGTLTDGNVYVSDALPEIDTEQFTSLMRTFAAAFPEGNATQKALSSYFPGGEYGDLPTVPFSSSRKFAGITLLSGGSFYAGASEMLFPGDEALKSKIAEFQEKGERVLVTGISPDPLSEHPDHLRYTGMISMRDSLKKDCEKTLAYLREQGVSLKCISGDNALTVSRIAEAAGLPDASRYIDLTELKTEEEIRKAAGTYSVFGRVTPEQKKILIESLKEEGRTAMIGDGVNDVLALKAADCSIAMGNGSDAAKHTADIILLNSDFSSVPDIVHEGRRVINNILASSAMYLIKTFFSVFLTLGVILIADRYPMQAVQLTLISATAVAIPTFFLQLEPNFSLVREGFMKQVIGLSLPAGLSIALISLLDVKLSSLSVFADIDAVSTLLVFFTAFVYFYMLSRVFKPFTRYRFFVILGASLLFLSAAFLFGRILFDLVPLKKEYLGLLALEIVLVPFLILLLTRIYNAVSDRFIRRFIQTQHEKS